MAQLDPSALKKERKSAGLTQAELAKKSGVAYSTLTKLEQGKIPSPSVTAMQDLAEVLHCTVADLMAAEKPTIQKREEIEFVYFDIGGVLIHWLPSVHGFAERINRPYNAVLKLFHEYDNAICRGNMHPDEFKLLCMLKLNIDIGKGGRDDALQSWVEDMRPILATHAMIKEVSKHYPIGLLTNIGKGYFEDFLERGLVPNLKYKTVVRSCDLGLVKPEPDIFKVATEAAQVAPEKILFIDDSKVNVTAAQHAGWQGAWFDEYHPQDAIRDITKRYFS